ncbi:hypothetical protein Hypma_013519 [Hypsizygus marmoreus]|uniref:F-box domain-containing protein n=1 Tax=Hypsizygus marmoreus TaxID=39966 RepID=A0A369JD54_HYPMA|nr:hypothetical protein Hypma_013519 [Hypsizygus marmoreus]
MDDSLLNFGVSAPSSLNQTPPAITEQSIRTRLASAELNFIELEAQIASAQRVLNTLNRQRKDDIRELRILRAAVAPHNKLPPEILSEIFEHYVDEPIVICSKQPQTVVSPFTLAHVSSKWRHIAFSTPSLWNRILIDCGDWTNMDTLTDIAHNYLQFSGSMPITLQTTGSFSQPRNHGLLDRSNLILDLILPFGTQIQHLTLSFPAVWMQNALDSYIAGFNWDFLESVELTYTASQYRDIHFSRVMRIFGNAPRLNKFSVTMGPEWPRVGTRDIFDLPWSQLTELHFTHLIIPITLIPVILRECTRLVKCTLSVAKEFVDAVAPFVPLSDLVMPTVRSLTLYNPMNFDCDKYLERISFPNLERLVVKIGGEGRNGRKWSQSQFSAIIARFGCSLKSLSTTADIDHADIESVLGDVPSLRELNVQHGQSISSSTLRLLCNGLIAPNLEVLKCIVDADLLPDFLDMLDCRYIPPKYRSSYTGIRSVVIHCETRTQGYRDVAERLEEFCTSGRDIVVKDQWDVSSDSFLDTEYHPFAF